jgi:two-component sensor histidine kinase
VIADKLAVRQARAAVRTLSDLSAETVLDAELVVSELVANSVLHARLEPADRIDVTLCRCGSRLTIVVDDRGGFTRRRAGGGLGFRVLGPLCEQWSAQNGCVRAVLRQAPRR